MTKTQDTLPELDMPTIIPDMGFKRPKMGVEMTYLEKNIIDKAIHKKLRNKDVYETYIQNIYNLVVGQTNDQLQEKV